MKLQRFIFSYIVALGFLFPLSAFATTGTIDATNDTSRLCTNTACTTYTIVYWRTTHGAPISVTDTVLTGDAWSASSGWIHLNPTSPAPTTPGCSDSHVLMSPSNTGTLTGCAWGSTASWVNFAPTHGGVTINTSTGEFSGYAWISGAGWMKFDCSLADACVKTDWRPTPTTCTDSSASNFGGALPCTYSHSYPPPKCLDPSALNYGGSLPCVYPITICSDPVATNYLAHASCTYATALCADHSATNYGGELPCTYAVTCEDSSAINYHAVGTCTYEVTSCIDTSATNYGGALPCRYGATCEDSSANNYHRTGACTYDIQRYCVDPGALNYGGAVPCVYRASICGDPSATNYRANGGCIYSTIVKTKTDNGCPVSTATDAVGVIADNVKNSLCETKSIIGQTFSHVKGIVTKGSGGIVTETVTTVGVVAGSAVTLTSALFLNPVSFSELFLIPARLWSLLMTALGLKKRRRPWGTVYDSVTKQPLDPAYVTLKNIEGKEITSNITDLDGRFGFVVPEPGTYTIFAQKTNYVFPSQKLVGHDHDELYRDLYFGEHFAVTEAGAVVIRNIPMDPEKFDWNEFAKREQSLMRFYSKRDKWFQRAANVFFGFGFIVSGVAVLAAPKTYNIIIFLLYVLLYFVRKHGAHSRPYGFLVDNATQIPLSFGIIRISNVATGVEVMHRIADAKGRYYALLPNGEYNVRIDRKLPDGTYETVASDKPVTVTNGYLAKVFLL